MLINIYSNGYQASIETLGAELKSFRDPDGKEYIWNSNPMYWKRSSPLLFPIIGNVRDNKTIIDGKEYNIPKHGFVNSMEFQYQSMDINQATFFINYNNETLSMYPFEFSLSICYQLNDNKLSISYKVENHSKKTMHYHIGAHPGFTCPLDEEETIEDYMIEFEENETLSSYVYDLSKLCFLFNSGYIHLEHQNQLHLKKEFFDSDAVYFRNTKSRYVNLISKNSNKGIQLQYPDFTSIALWTPIGANAPFLCIEPWNGAAIFDDEDNNLSHKRDIQLLEANKKKVHNLYMIILNERGN